jgi:hypothetical protein
MGRTRVKITPSINQQDLAGKRLGRHRQRLVDACAFATRVDLSRRQLLRSMDQWLMKHTSWSTRGRR